MKNGNIITRSSLLSEFSEDKIVRCVVHTVLYVCTCLCATICADALIRTTICKHIHLVFRFNFKDSKTVDGNETLNQTMDLQDDVTSPVEDISVTSGHCAESWSPNPVSVNYGRCAESWLPNHVSVTSGHCAESWSPNPVSVNYGRCAESGSPNHVSVTSCRCAKSWLLSHPGRPTQSV